MKQAKIRDRPSRSISMRRLCSSAMAAVLGLGAVTAMTIPTNAQAYVSVGISVGFAPPPLPVYSQPPIPGPGYIWTPGYWAWDGDDEDYYWVPGAWVLAPEPGLLWTPAWWGWDNGVYLFHTGYWGPEVGFYGGVPYGFGYTGFGYEGGYWEHNRFFYNRTVNNITNVNIVNVYNRPVTRNTFTHVSFNGPGGVTARPTPQQMAAERARHFAPTQIQVRHQQLAARDPVQRASRNHGAPPIAATVKPASFKGPGVVRSVQAGGAYHPPPMAARAAMARPGAKAPNGGNAPMANAMNARHAAPGAQPRTAFNAPEHGAPPRGGVHTPERAPYAANRQAMRPYERPAPGHPAAERPEARAYAPPHAPSSERYARTETYNRPYVRPQAEYRATPEARAYHPPPQYRAPPEARVNRPPPMAKYRAPPQRAEPRGGPPPRQQRREEPRRPGEHER